ILPLHLELRRAIASLPVRALAIEDEVTGQVAPDHSNNSIQRGVRVRVSLNILRENARTGVPKLAGLQKRFHLAGPRFGRQKAAITMTLNRLEPRPLVLRYEETTQARERPAFRFATPPVHVH